MNTEISPVPSDKNYGCVDLEKKFYKQNINLEEFKN
jgi:hypothetical protein